jgi:hypothetical protein
VIKIEKIHYLKEKISIENRRLKVLRGILMDEPSWRKRFTYPISIEKFPLYQYGSQICQSLPPVFIVVTLSKTTHTSCLTEADAVLLITESRPECN